MEQPLGVHDVETTAVNQTIALLATEWFKATRRALKITAEKDPTRLAREKALLAYSHRRVGDALEQLGLRLCVFDSHEYSPAVPAEPVNPEDFESEEGLIVAETIEPTVLYQGRILLRGKILLAKGNP